MKTTDMSYSGDQSCSCTSCTFQSESDRPSLRRIISKGSRIDRLYYGKYIPLRERKLLERLVRTRGVYDDIRAKLLSNSTMSLDTKATFEPQTKSSVKKLNNATKSPAILELVNLVDKGDKLESKELSGCCSCCSCSSKINLHYHSINKRRRRYALPNVYTREKAGELYNRKKGVRFKAKHIRSDPCTCTFKFSGMVKTLSKIAPKKVRVNHPVIDLQPNTDEEISQKPQNIGHIAAPLYEAIQQSEISFRETIMKGIRKLNESKTKIQEKIDLQAKKSLDQINKLQNNIKSKMKVHKKMREIPKNNVISTCECPENNILSQIKKDSISKFKDDLKRKQLLKDWECDPECIEDTCIPEDCYYKLKQIGTRHFKRKYDRYKEEKGGEIIQKEMIGKPLLIPSIKIQSGHVTKTVPTETDELKTLSHAKQTRKMTKPWLSFNNNKESKITKKSQKITKNDNKKKIKLLCKCKTTSNHRSQNVKSSSTLPVNPVINKIKVESKRIKLSREKEMYPKTKVGNINLERKTSQRQAVRIGSSFTFNIEFYKNKAEPPEGKSLINLQKLPEYSAKSLLKNNDKTTANYKSQHQQHQRQRGSQIKFNQMKKNRKTGGDDLKRCFCPIKFKSKRNKTKTQIEKDKATAVKSSLVFSSANVLCTPSDCAITNKCNEIECKRKNLQLLNNVETNTYYTYPNVIEIKKRGQKRFQAKQILQPYECEPGVCIPDNCDPYQCIKLINTRKQKRKQKSVQCACSPNILHSRKTKSTSSLTSKSNIPSKPKFVKSIIKYKSGNTKNKRNKIYKMKTGNVNNAHTSGNTRQVVRIGSTFSFNLEFYRNKSSNSFKRDNLKKLPISKTHHKSYKKKGNQMNIEDNNEIIPTPVYKKDGIGNAFKRCFCTLKIQEKKNIKTKRQKMVTLGTDNINDTHSNVAVTYNKSTKTKKNRTLKDYECEPFICIPGSCDPYDCLERINKRFKRLKEIGSITEPPESKSASSTTNPNKALRTTHVQFKPQSKDRKSLTKSKMIVSKLKKYSPSDKNNQAVKIGSSFSFDIEFFKTNMPGKRINSKPQLEQKIKKHSRNAKKNKKSKINKLDFADITTQFTENKKNSKASMAGHLVKRCLCTLNLQKYRNRQSDLFSKHAFLFPINYTINRAMTVLTPTVGNKSYERKLKSSEVAIAISDDDRNRYSNLNQLQPIFLQEISSVVEEQSQSCNLPIDIDELKSSISFIEDKLKTLFPLKQIEVTNLTEYLRHCFCTMNLQLVNLNKKPKETTDISEYNTLKNNKEISKCDKSSVRVGSNFSFNIEFSKNLSSSKSRRHVDNLNQSKYTSDTKFTKPIENKLKKIKSIGIKRPGIYLDQQSQSAVNKMLHKTSGTKPMVRRCFCTLKLQKRGKWHSKKKQELFMKKPITIDPMLTRVKTINRAQNTVFKPLNIAQSLKPYECEPNICNPGYCDPYQCLEIMKRKKVYKHTKESAVETIQNKKSVSSITTENYSKGTQKSDFVKLKSNKIANTVKPSRKSFKSDVCKPSRQVVRIGSNFSFNIEFFKDQNQNIKRRTQNIDLKENKMKQVIHLPKINKRIEDPLQTSSQTSKFVRHKETEIKRSPRIASTMTTSFTKRCFCTAQLKGFKQKNGKLNSSDNSSPTFFTKCLCLLKSFKPLTVPNKEIHIKKIRHFNKKTNTRNTSISEEELLSRFECEPGSCIPGECNPYDCDKILKRKKGKRISKASTTAESNKSRSAFTKSPVIITKNIQTKLINRKRDKTTKKHGFSRTSMETSDRQVVKIGSNFSFNIEFYKSNLPKSKSLPPLQISLNPKENKYNKFKRRKIQNEIISTRSKWSQAEPIDKVDRAIEEKQFLKRCFCTLQLHKQYSQIPKTLINENKQNQGTKLRTKSVMTEKVKRHLNLSKIYECKPGVCVPYECDPYECERIIKLRRNQQEYKEIGILTKYPKRINASSTTGSFKKFKQKTQTTLHKKYYGIVNHKDKYRDTRPLQRVKIGSSFDFNIEFFKDKTNLGLEINKKPRYMHTKSILSPLPKMKTTKTQNFNYKQVKFAKIGKDATKSQSTTANVSPLLKRCFCTLFLKKPKKVKRPPSKTSSIGVETHKPPTHAKLLPYECEPQICIPGECNPIECLERIKKKDYKNFGGSTNFSQKVNTTNTMTKGKAKTKTKKNQFKTLNKDRLIPKKTFSEDSRKQAVRIGSNISFNIEFYKSNKTPCNNSKKRKQRNQHRRVKISEVKMNQIDITNLDNKIKSSPPNISSTYKQNKSCVVSNCPEFKKISTIQSKEKTRAHTFLKKCFCVFKLHKIRNQHKFISPSLDYENHKHQVSPRRQNEIVSTKQNLLPFECEPNVCVPLKCDPYECEKRIIKRILRTKKEKESYISHKMAGTDKVKSKSIMTHIIREGKDVNIMADNHETKQHQSNRKSTAKTLPFKTNFDNNGNMKTPNLTSNFNKQVVKIGSNFNFNVEFYKETKPKHRLITLENIKHEIPKHIKARPIHNTIDNVDTKNISTNSRFINDRGSQAMLTKTEDKSLEVQNALSRCFCTLQLQKNMQSRYRKKHLNSSRESPQYPQTFEIRRVTVHHKNKTASKRTCTTMTSVATRTNNKYMKENMNFRPLHNFCPCKKSIDSTEMETIYPYKPIKFKKTSSKTVFPMPNNFLIKNKTKRKSLTDFGKKLKIKKSKRNLHYNKQNLDQNESKVKTISHNIKGFLCRCVTIFSLKQKNNILINNGSYKENYIDNKFKTDIQKQKPTYNRCSDHLRSSKSDRKPKHHINKNQELKKSRSLKLDGKYINKNVPHSLNKFCYNENCPVVSLRVKQKRNHTKDVSKENEKLNEGFKSAKLIPETEIFAKTEKKSIERKIKENEIMCTHCQMKLEEKISRNKESPSPLKVHFVDTTSKNVLVKTPTFKKRFKSLGKPLKHNRQNEKRSEVYNYCDCNEDRLNKVELQKAAGDHPTYNLNKENLQKHTKYSIKDIFKFKRNIDNVCKGKYGQVPLFEMQLDCDDYDIINKDEVIDNVTKLSIKNMRTGKQLSKSHKKTCRCCICLSKKNKTGAHIHVAAKGSKMGRNLKKLLGSSKPKSCTLGKPCICGSLDCYKEKQKFMKKSRRDNRKYWKPCFCGSPICKRESATMKALSFSTDKMRCICKEENERRIKKIKAKEKNKEDKLHAIFLKKQNKEDSIRRRKRRKEDKEMEKRINKKAGDLVLAAESAIDIGKLGITACTDILRSVARCSSDPKQAYYTLKAMKEDPKLLARKLKFAFSDSGVASTARRVRLRCLAMRGVKKVKTTLEKYAITNFLLHIADKDPKRRLLKKTKPKRVRERFDFQCSLYMASLRKRPFLSIYDRCPWFYPHFLSIINVWKQFTDIMLFLLAVVVWSPCILCMEVCRAMMCCFFCTG